MDQRPFLRCLAGAYVQNLLDATINAKATDERLQLFVVMPDNPVDIVAYMLIVGLHATNYAKHTINGRL